MTMCVAIKSFEEITQQRGIKHEGVGSTKEKVVKSEKAAFKNNPSDKKG